MKKVEIWDSVHKKLRMVALKQDKTFRRLVNEILERYLKDKEVLVSYLKDKGKKNDL